MKIFNEFAGILQKMKEVELKIQAKVESLKHANEGDKGTKPIWPPNFQLRIKIQHGLLFQFIPFIFVSKLPFKAHCIYFYFFYFKLFVN